LDKAFVHIHTFLKQNKLIGILLLTVILGTLAFTASRIQFEEDISKLIPVDESNKELEKVLNSVKFKDKIIVNISIEDQGTVDDLTAYASCYVDSLEAHSEFPIASIQGRAGEDDLSKVMDFAYDHLPLFLEEEDYLSIDSSLTEERIKESTAQNYRTLISPTGIMARKTIQRDPLGMSFIALEKLKQLSLVDDFIMHDGYLLNAKKTNLLLFLSPDVHSTETDMNDDLVTYLGSLDLALDAEFQGKASAEIFGAPVVAVSNAQQIKSDIHFTVGIAMSILLLIFILFYKNIYVPVILFIPTAFGALVAIAFLSVFRGEISAISLGIGAVLIGITLDYSLHVLTHLRSDPDVKRLYREVATPILMSSLTTAVAFFCLIFVDSQALQDLGIFAGLSVLSASVFALTLMPLIYKSKVGEEQRTTVLDRLATYPLHKNKWMIIVLVVLTVTSLFKYDEVIFNKDLSTMNYFSEELQAAEKRLDEVSDFSSHSVYLCAYSDTLETALHSNELLFDRLNTMQEEGKILDFSSVGGILLSQKTQQEKIKKWKDFWSHERKNRTKEYLVKSGAEVGFKESTYEPFYAMLEEDKQPLSLSGYENLSVIDLDDFLSHEKDFNTLTTLVKVSEEQEAFLKSSVKEMDHVMAIDRKEMNEMFLGNLKNDFNSLMIYSFIAVTLILLLFYRDIPLMVVTLLPVCLTWFLTIGTMAVIGIQFNIFNIIISTFIFGLGIDYSIFITNGLLRSLRTGENKLSTYRTSIILSLLTTVLGMGVLIFAKHPALYTISLVCMIGVISAVLMAFTIQPLLFKLLIGGKKKGPTTIREFLFSVMSFLYFGLGAMIFSFLSVMLFQLLPINKKTKFKWFHTLISKFLKSVLYTNPFVKKRVLNPLKESFDKPAMIIANHSSFLDILTILMLHPKIIILVNDWVYNSPIFGKAVQYAGFYPVSQGIAEGESHLRTKMSQGYHLMAFPEGTRSYTNSMKRFHKGAFYLAEELGLDIVPVLIHGNSEVLPKNHFVIRDGIITVEILKRIPHGTKEYGTDSRAQTKNISAYFKKEYARLREELEDETYFHRMVLDHFRYSEIPSFKEIKQDLNRYASAYFKVLKYLEKKEEIACISDRSGQLPVLLLCDSPDRKVHAYVEDSEHQDYLEDRHITERTNNLSLYSEQKDVLAVSARTLILNSNNCTFEKLGKEIILRYERLVQLRPISTYTQETFQIPGFKLIHETEDLHIFESTKEKA
jgi:1-acyl-sn-glycerol-3-phosphate acyltransferase